MTRHTAPKDTGCLYYVAKTAGLLVGRSRAVWLPKRVLHEQAMINVVHFVMDDLRSELSAAYGRRHVHTPHMDELAARGLAFRRAYSQISLCGPSRSSFMSGRRPAATRCLEKSDFRVAPGAQEWLSLPEQFKVRSYSTTQRRTCHLWRPATQCLCHMRRPTATSVSPSAKPSTPPARRAASTAAASARSRRRGASTPGGPTQGARASA